MKNLLLPLMLLGCALGVNAQVLDQDTFSYSDGNFSTATNYTGSGVSSSSGGYTLMTEQSSATSGIDATGFAIVSYASSKAIKMKGPLDNGGSSFLYRNNAVNAWSQRTSGNNILRMSYDVYVSSDVANTNNYFNLLINGNLSNGGTIKWVVSYSPKKTNNGPGITATSSVTANGSTGGSNGSLFGGINENAWNKIQVEVVPQKGTIYVSINDNPGNSIMLQYSGSDVIIDPTSIKYSTSASTSAPTPMANPSSNKAKSIQTTTQYDFYLKGFTIQAVNQSVLTTKILEEKPQSAITKLEVYPNPSTDVVNINTPSALLNTEVYNSAGQLLITSSNNSIDISALGKGTYTFKIATKDGTYSKQVIKN